MFCYKCGKEIDDEAIVCVHCGVATKNDTGNAQQAQPVIINNSAASSTEIVNRRIRRHYSFFVDLIMLFLTSGLWLIWMIFRPKYYWI